MWFNPDRPDLIHGPFNNTKQRCCNKKEKDKAYHGCNPILIHCPDVFQGISYLVNATFIQNVFQSFKQSLRKCLSIHEESKQPDKYNEDRRDRKVGEESRRTGQPKRIVLLKQSEGGSEL